MKTFAVLLLAAALCVERGSSLSCYSCSKASSHDQCQSVQCSHMDRYCLSREFPADTGEMRLISKWCSDSCPTSSETKGGRAVPPTQCCDYDNCNNGAPVSVKTSYTILVLATLASFFYVFQTGL